MSVYDINPDNWKELFAEKKIGFVQTVDSIPKKQNKNTIVSAEREYWKALEKLAYDDGWQL